MARAEVLTLVRQAAGLGTGVQKEIQEADWGAKCACVCDIVPLRSGLISSNADMVKQCCTLQAKGLNNIVPANARRRMVAMGLPIAFVLAAVSFLLQEYPSDLCDQLDAVEYFAGSKTWATALRAGGLSVSVHANASACQTEHACGIHFTGNSKRPRLAPPPTTAHKALATNPLARDSTRTNPNGFWRQRQVIDTFVKIPLGLAKQSTKDTLMRPSIALKDILKDDCYVPEVWISASFR